MAGYGAAAFFCAAVESNESDGRTRISLAPHGHSMNKAGHDEDNANQITELSAMDRFTRYKTIHEQVNKLLEETDAPLRKKILTSLAVIEDALAKYGFQGIALSFNGGKDCLVLLTLYVAVLAKLPLSVTDRVQKIPTCFVTPLHSFPEMEDFVTSCAAAYSLDVVRICKPMRAAFQDYLSQRPQIKAVLVGTRCSDPNGSNLTHFDFTDHGWPPFMRIHPVIDWHYADIWRFIRTLKISYCSLYDQGFTSLGGRQDTHPNPKLMRNNDKHPIYFPAYQLEDESQERCGRDI